MKRICIAVVAAAAACLALSACVQAPAGSSARGMDVSQLPGPPGAVPEYQGPPRPLMPEPSSAQFEDKARDGATRELRPGVAGGGRAELPPPQEPYEYPSPALPEPQPIPPANLPELTLPSLQE